VVPSGATRGWCRVQKVEHCIFMHLITHFSMPKCNSSFVTFRRKNKRGVGNGMGGCWLEKQMENERNSGETKRNEFSL